MTTSSCAVPSARCHAASQSQTRSPTRLVATPSPPASIVPAPSWLGTSSGNGSSAPGASPAARLPVGGIHARDLHLDPHLTSSRFAHRSLDETEDLWSTGLGIHNRSHMHLVFAEPLTYPAELRLNAQSMSTGRHFRGQNADGKPSVFSRIGGQPQLPFLLATIRAGAPPPRGLARLLAAVRPLR